MALLEREAAKRVVKQHAAKMILHFVRARRKDLFESLREEENPNFGDGITKSFKRRRGTGRDLTGFERRMLFQKAKETSRMDADACSADTVRLEQAVVRAKFVNSALAHLTAKAGRLTLSAEADEYFHQLRSPGFSEEQKQVAPQNPCRALERSVGLTRVRVLRRLR